jgi:cytochrome c oxidase subunit 1
MGMPRRYYDYLPEFQIYHVISTVGSWILALGLIILVINLFISLRRGARAPANPWGGKTLEWKVPSPPPLENFDEVPVITTGPYDYSEYERQPAEEA